MENLRLRLLSNVVIAYMLIAFTWWTVLLYTKNRDAFFAKAHSLQLVMAAEKKIQNSSEFNATPEFQALQTQYQRQEWMIFGEALFFIISLVIGIYLINRGYNNEMVAAQERRNFLLSITHELKSPLASIRLVLDTFRKRELKTAQIHQLSGTALEETERLTSLVEDLLLAAKLETTYQPVWEPIHPTEITGNLVQKMVDKFPNANFNFHHDNEIPQISADKTGFTSILINLMENAVKYSPSPAKIDIHLSKKEKGIFLKIADQGFGITDKEKKKIFKKFYRIGNEDTRSTKGTGLGLYIVKEIVEAHHGNISVENNAPKGTVFNIFIPFGTEEY